MNKIMCMVTMLLAVTVGQTSTANLQFGLVGGLNFASADVEIMEEGADVSSNTVFGIGGVIDWNLNQTFSLRLEPMYLQKGLGKTELEIQPGVEFYLKSSYLELPVLLKFEFGERLRPYIVAGPSFGLLLDTEVTAKINNITLKGDSKKATENIDISIVVGGGFSYQLENLSIFLESNYYYGLTNNIKGGVVDLSIQNVTEELEWNKDTDKIYDRGLQIMIGITFPI